MLILFAVSRFFALSAIGRAIFNASAGFALSVRFFISMKSIYSPFAHHMTPSAARQRPWNYSEVKPPNRIEIWGRANVSVT